MNSNLRDGILVEWKRFFRPRRMLLAMLLFLSPIVVYYAGRLILLKPSAEREWIAKQAVQAEVNFDGNLVHIGNVRNFIYRTAEDFEPRYENRTYDLEKIESAWFILSSFGANWRGPAHGFMSFGFSDSQYVAISVESRKEESEAYSLWKGLFNTFEVIYVIGDERDLIGQRAVASHDEVLVYPIDTSRELVRRMFVAMLERATALVESPEFYNTITNNCTINLYDHARHLAPQRWSYSWRLQFPGYEDELLLDMGLIDTDLSLKEARERFRVNERAERYLGDPEFSSLIRKGP